MGRNSKYDDDALLDAVLMYAEVQSEGKIKIVDLVAYARASIAGLEDVEDRHFSRPVRVKDKNGKTVLVNRPCMERLEQINEQRKLREAEKNNILFSDIGLDEFFELDCTAQRRALEKSKQAYADMRSLTAKMSVENDELRREITELRVRLEKAEKQDTDGLMKKASILEKKYTYIAKALEDNENRKYLETIGIKQGEISPRTHDEFMEKLNAKKCIIGMPDQEETLEQSDAIKTDEEYDAVTDSLMSLL